MCGNTMVWKPSSHTPGATQLQAELWTEAGGPDGTFNIVYGGREAVTAIVEHPDVPAIQFVGSTAVGRYVFETGTQHGKRVGSYTSAKNAMIVLPDADMALTADAAVASGYGSAGERCMAQTLVIAVGDAADRLRPLIARADREAQGRPRHGAGCRHGSDLHAGAPRVGHRVDRQGRRGGGRARRRRAAVRAPASTRTASSSACRCSTTSPPSMQIYQEEIFGPVLGIVRADTYDEAIAPHQRPQVRERHGDLHDRRRRRPALQARSATSR